MQPTNNESAIGTPPNSGSSVVKPKSKLEVSVNVENLPIFTSIAECLLYAMTLLDDDGKEKVQQHMIAAGVLEGPSGNFLVPNTAKKAKPECTCSSKGPCYNCR